MEELNGKNLDNKKEYPAESGVSFDKFVEGGIEISLAHIRDNYENRKNPLENLAFHNTGHTKTIVRRVDKILEALGADTRTRSLGRLFAGGHDTVQNWEAKTAENGNIVRDRSPFPNERDSFRMIGDYMEAVNKNEGREIFTEEDIALGDEAIMATKASGPGSWDSERGTVIQQNLNEKSSLLARVLALADIGGAGMDGGKQFIYEGNTFFREDNLDILDVMSHAEKLSALTDEQKESLRKRMISWGVSQQKFAEGRMARFEMEIAGLTEKEKDVLRKEIFNKFDNSIEAVKNKASERESMGFEELARDFGYTI
ncbi:MAG: hypothetical protein KGJ89_01430 [Patescibacteria group bacterium]|nr:hypothetical protein [Patescibacteria group bacterium]MDE2015174.1 hypothetical protein [Patescibacteria group bacterium]MDE2226602.1 hypothetical protein [Patescibacteria group bacterium]